MRPKVDPTPVVELPVPARSRSGLRRRITLGPPELEALADISDILRRGGLSKHTFRAVAARVDGVVPIDVFAIVPRAITAGELVWCSDETSLDEASPALTHALRLLAETVLPRPTPSTDVGAGTGSGWAGLPLSIDGVELLGALCIRWRGETPGAPVLAFLSCVSKHLASVYAISTPTTSTERPADDLASAKILAEVTMTLLSDHEVATTIPYLARLLGTRFRCNCVIDFTDGRGGRSLGYGEAAEALAVAVAIERLGLETEDSRCVSYGIGVPSDSAARTACLAMSADWLIHVPLCAHGERVGALTCFGTGSENGPAPTPALVRAVAHRAAAAIVNDRMFRQASEAIADRERLLATVSHDLRSPLGVILTTVHQILAEAPSADRRASSRRRIEAIRRSAERMNGLVDDLLDFAALEAGALPMHPSACDLGALLGEVVPATDAQGRSAGSQVVLDLPDALPRVWVDEKRIAQVVANLVGNAIKFTSKGLIRIVARAIGGEVQVSVIDNGAGISATELPRVFERFRRGQSEGAGYGLGLAICKCIVEQSHGRIWIESRLGEGTTVSFTVLPAPDNSGVSSRT